MHPVSRFPVFLMGIYAGELGVRHSDIMPWPSSYFRLHNPEDKEDTALRVGICADTLIWKDRVMRQTITLLSLTLLVFICDTTALIVNHFGVLGAFWFHGIVAFAQLELLVALTRDGGATQLSKWFSTSVGIWLGDRSMAIYLVHWPLIGYLCFMIHGKPLPYPRHYLGKCDKYHNGSDEYRHAHMSRIPGFKII